MERDTVIRIGIAGLVIVLVAGMVFGAVFILESLDQEDGELVIYSYDSFVTWGLGPAVKAAFEEEHGVNVTIVKCGDVGGLIGRLDAEKGDPRADVALGIDNSMLHIALDKGILSTYEPPNIGMANASLVFDPEYHVVPYDHGYLAIICNSTAMEKGGIPYPRSLLDLAMPVYDGKMMLMDPATSSTGSSFLIWSAAVAGDGLGAFLDGLADNTNGRVVGTWDAMYAAFSAGEVPMAISYGLDTAFEKMAYDTENTVTIVPDREGYRQIEGVGIVQGARHRDLAEEFVRFCLTDAFQSKVGYNVMLPVVPGTFVDPVLLQYGRTASVHVEPSLGTVRAEYEGWLDEWDRAFS